MRKSKFSEHQIIAILKAVEAGRTVRDVCREHEISEATYYQWRSKYGGMQASDIKRLRELGRREPTIEADLRRLVAGESGAERCDSKKAVTPAVKRELVVTLRRQHGLSERRACAPVNLRRSVYRYRCRPNRDGWLSCSCSRPISDRGKDFQSCSS